MKEMNNIYQTKASAPDVEDSRKTWRSHAMCNTSQPRLLVVPRAMKWHRFAVRGHWEHYIPANCKRMNWWRYRYKRMYSTKNGCMSYTMLLISIDLHIAKLKITYSKLGFFPHTIYWMKICTSMTSLKRHELIFVHRLLTSRIHVRIPPRHTLCQRSLPTLWTFIVFAKAV